MTGCCLHSLSVTCSCIFQGSSNKVHQRFHSYTVPTSGTSSLAQSLCWGLKHFIYYMSCQNSERNLRVKLSVACCTVQYLSDSVFQWPGIKCSYRSLDGYTNPHSDKKMYTHLHNRNKAHSNSVCFSAFKRVFDIW